MRITPAVASIVSLLLLQTSARADVHGAHAPEKESSHAAASPAVTNGVSPDDALQMLVDGNRRFVGGEATLPHADQMRRCETFAIGQHPFASILSCADSRVPPEILFDQGVGDLFVVRVAGNVADVDELATLEYGAAHLGSRLIVVMGHTKCGAVTAVVDGAKVKGNLAGLLDNIVPAVANTKASNPELKGSPLVVKAIRANVYQSMADVFTNSPDLKAMIAEKKIKLVGAVYDIHGGTIDWLGEHPRQAELLAAADTQDEKPDAHAEKMHAHNHADSHGDKPSAKPSAKQTHDAHSDDHADHSKPKPKKDSAVDFAGDKHSDASDKPADSAADSPLKKYGAIGAFSVGALALSAVVLTLMRK